jgi:hypothetical protein
MAQPERPDLAQTDRESIRYVEKRVLVVELCDLNTWRLTSSTIDFVPSQDNGELIIERSVTSTEADNRKSRLWPGQHTG